MQIKRAGRIWTSSSRGNEHGLVDQALLENVVIERYSFGKNADQEVQFQYGGAGGVQTQT